MHTNSDQFVKELLQSASLKENSENSNIKYWLDYGEYILQGICQNTLTKSHKNSFLIWHEWSQRWNTTQMKWLLLNMKKIVKKKDGNYWLQWKVPARKYMFPDTQYGRRTNTMIFTKFLKKISHFQCFFKVIILDFQNRTCYNQSRFFFFLTQRYYVSWATNRVHYIWESVEHRHLHLHMS